MNMEGVRKRGKRPSTRTSKRGAPKLVIVPDDLYGEPRPEEYPTLLKYAEAQGHIKHTSKAQLLQARHLFVSRALRVGDVAHKVGLPVSVIMRWIVIHAWQEERDKRHFEAFRRLTGKLDSLSPHTDERHDRIAGSIEEVIERMLSAHHDDETELDPKDLQIIASTLKTTAEIRRSIRGKSSATSEKKVNININMPENLDRVGAMVSHLAEERPALPAPKRHRIEVTSGEHLSTDDEYEDEAEDAQEA